MSFAYSRLGVSLMVAVSLGAAAAFLVQGVKIFRDETAFYGGSVSGTARILSNQFRPGGRASVGWTVAYEFSALPGSDAVHRGPTRSYPQAIDTQRKPGDSVPIRYRPDDPSQNALETGGAVLWYAYLMFAGGVFFLFLAVCFAATWSGLRR